MLGDERYLYLGFHGCEKQLAMEILLQKKDFHQSTNDYDWLGSGIYFWENDPQRAYEFAGDVKQCNEPFVLGAVLDLGYCLDLTCRKHVQSLVSVWSTIVRPIYDSGNIKPNKPGRNVGENGELMLRFLDKYVIESLHKFNEAKGFEAYDTVRAGFWEGQEIYPTAGFREKNHIQICIRNPKCVLGVFLPKR